MRYARELRQNPMTPELFPRTTALIRTGLQEGVTPGMVAGVWAGWAPDEIWVGAGGNRRDVPSALPMLPDTIFDLASVTKVFATSTLAAVLVDRRWIAWDTPVRSLLPDFAFSGINLGHLLSHTAGFPAWEPLWERLRDHFSPVPLHEIAVSARQRLMRGLVLAVEPETAVGERALYSDISFLLLGFALEEAVRMSLDHAVERLVWQPLGVENASYHRITRGASARDERVAATEDSAWRGGVLQGQVHDDNCWAMGGYAGHAGAFSDARDLLHFSRRLLGGFLSRETLRAAWTRVPLPAGCDRTLGWDAPAATGSSAGRIFSRSSVGHLGFTGTSLWIDPEAEVAVTLLTNRVHPSRENIRIREFRPGLHDAIREDLAQLRASL